MDEKVDTTESAEHPASDKSILDLLKADYQELVDIKDVYIPIIGWEKTGLAINYRLPETGAELDIIARKVLREVPKNDSYKRNLMIALDTMIALHQGLYVKPPEMALDDYVQLDPQETGQALELADVEELSAIFGWKDAPDSARAVLRKLFANNDLSILNHTEKLQRWLVDTKADITTELWSLGEMNL